MSGDDSKTVQTQKLEALGRFAGGIGMRLKPGMGTTFKIILPLASAASSPVEEEKLCRILARALERRNEREKSAKPEL